MLDCTPDASDYAKTLIYAHKLLTDAGWCQRTASTPNGKLCLIAAIVGASYHLGYEYTAGRDMLTLVRERSGIPYLFIWNDDPSRTKDEVLALLTTLISKELLHDKAQNTTTHLTQHSLQHT